MKVTVGGYYLDVKQIEDEQTAMSIARTAPLGYLLLQDDSSDNADWYVVNIVREIGVFSVLVKAPDTGASPHMMIHEERQRLIIGYGHSLSILNAAMFDELFYYDGGSAFYQIFSLRPQHIDDVFIGWFENRMVALTYEGEVLWTYEAAAIITDAVLIDDAIEIRVWNKDHPLLLELYDGTIR